MSLFYSVLCPVSIEFKQTSRESQAKIIIIIIINKNRKIRMQVFVSTRSTYVYLEELSIKQA
jgi:hypothetical protein